MNIYKKMISMTLIAALSFSLAACGQSKSTTGSSNASQAGSVASSSNSASSNSAAASFNKPEDLKAYNLAAQRGTIGESLAKELVEHENQLNTFEKYIDAITALEQDKVQGVVMDEKPAKKFVAEKTDLVILDEPMSDEAYSIAIKKGNSELLSEVNDALKEIKADGTLSKIIEKYNNDVSVKPEDIDLNVGASGGQLVMGTEAGFAPYELKVGSGFIGIDVEMMAAIAHKLNKELVIENMNFDALPMAVNSGKIDLAVAGITVTEERKQNMDFSDPYIDDARQVMVVKK